MERDRKWKCFLDVETLDCPICVEPLSMPVYQCENGHPICSSCSTKVSSKGCPSCLRPTGRIRCLAVEKILESLLVPCKHDRHGCKEMLPYNNRAERDDHEKRACKFQSFPCPFPLCTHEGPLATFSPHLTDAHGVRRTQLDFDEDRPRVEFRMSSDERCVMIEVERAAGSGSNYVVDAHSHVVDVLIVVHRENEDALGDWFFCTVYGDLPLMKYKLKVKRAEGRSGPAMHSLRAAVHNSSRESERAAARGFVDRLMVPIVPNGNGNLPRLFDVKIILGPHRRSYGATRHQESMSIPTSFNPTSLFGMGQGRGLGRGLGRGRAFPEGCTVGEVMGRGRECEVMGRGRGCEVMGRGRGREVMGRGQGRGHAFPEGCTVGEVLGIEQ